MCRLNLPSRKNLSLFETIFKLLIVLILSSNYLACSSAKLQETTEALQRDVDDMRRLQAQHTEAISQTRDELRIISGKVEELQYVSVGKTKELEQTLQRFSSRVPPPPGVPEDLLNQDEELISRISGPAADSYRLGLQQLRGGDFEGAKTTFNNFSVANQGTAFSDNALFWIGICYEKLGYYDRSIISYNDVIQRYPAEDRVAPSLLHLGESFMKLGQNEDAKLTFQKLIEEHPSSVFTKEARDRIRSMSSSRGSGARR